MWYLYLLCFPLYVMDSSYAIIWALMVQYLPIGGYEMYAFIMFLIMGIVFKYIKPEVK